MLNKVIFDQLQVIGLSMSLVNLICLYSPWPPNLIVPPLEKWYLSSFMIEIYLRCYVFLRQLEMVDGASDLFSFVND